jgi:CelD/BcsL family acetyltransferase involved in cellulose biosynthesis
MRVELTEDPSAFRARDWTPVVGADPSGTFFHTPAYLKLWWEEFGSGRLVLAFALESERTVGACGFEIVEGCLRFLGGFDVTDYMGPVSIEGYADAVSDALLGAAAVRLAWDRADLRGIPIDSPWLAALVGAARARGMSVSEGDDGVAPRIELPASHGEYLGFLPSKLRHEMRRKQRRLLEEAGPYRITVSAPETVPRDLDRFIELHKQSPGAKGKFMHAGMEIFFRRLGEALSRPHVFHLAFLEMGGEKVAGAIGFSYKEVFSLYNSAFDRDFARLSPGMVLVADLIERAIALGRSRFDMLKGDIDYKYRFGSKPRQIRKIELRR